MKTRTLIFYQVQMRATKRAWVVIREEKTRLEGIAGLTELKNISTPDKQFRLARLTVKTKREIVAR